MGFFFIPILVNYVYFPFYIFIYIYAYNSFKLFIIHQEIKIVFTSRLYRHPIQEILLILNPYL